MERMQKILLSAKTATIIRGKICMLVYNWMNRIVRNKANVECYNRMIQKRQARLSVYCVNGSFGISYLCGWKASIYDGLQYCKQLCSAPRHRSAGRIRCVLAGQGPDQYGCAIHWSCSRTGMRAVLPAIPMMCLEKIPYSQFRGRSRLRQKQF